MYLGNTIIEYVENFSGTNVKLYKHDKVPNSDLVPKL